MIGSGTSLDSARLRNAIGEQLTIDPRDIQIYVLGEHGDTQFPVWSHGNIGGLSVHEWLEKHPNFSEQDRISAWLQKKWKMPLMTSLLPKVRHIMG